jgi:2-polyprenyl-6-hydroxyphenyl methylase/3-demethylubiquinone-9 3-methyltransferase
MVHPQTAPASSIDAREVAQFAALAETWWDPTGPMRPLHALNPVRVGYIRDQALARFGGETNSLRPLLGKQVLDIGCGGGLVAEPLARLGGQVTAIDAAAESIAVACTHAEEAGLKIDYRVTTAEALLAEGKHYDIVTALEVVEHVADPAAFLATCAALVAPGGLLILSTLNRTPQAFGLAIVGAEYLLRLLPRGTHSWRKFRKPSELAGPLRASGLAVTDVSGLAFSPLTGEWARSPSLAVNYILCAARPALA